MNRRGFLTGAALAAASSLLPARTIFLPPAGGWLVTPRGNPILTVAEWNAVIRDGLNEAWRQAYAKSFGVMGPPAEYDHHISFHTNGVERFRI